ncbi:MAG: AAA family ATPase [Candidatus Hodarchaeota archaeon]
MGYIGIVITGTSCAGKSTVARRLCEKYRDFQVVHAVTTRARRSNDQDNFYDYLSKEGFNALDRDKKLLVKTRYRDEEYGITKQAIKLVLDGKKVPILVLTPESAKMLQKQSTGGQSVTFLTIFLDAPDSVLDARLHSRGDQPDEVIKKQRAEDRQHIKNCLYVLNNNNNTNVDDIAELVCSLWSYRRVGGLLPGRIIQSMINCGMLLKDADVDKVSGASYDLLLGDQYWQDGKKRILDSDNSFVQLKPGDYAILSSKEVADFPRDIAGKFDLTVSLFCQGVILSNGPQVDPGFSGRLFCLLFNTSNNTISLKRGEHYATLEFIKLVEPTTPYSGKYQGKDDIIDYLPKPSEPSVISQIKKDVESLKSAKWWEKRLPLFISILAIILTVVFAVILFFIQKPE